MAYNDHEERIEPGDITSAFIQSLQSLQSLTRRLSAKEPAVKAPSYLSASSAR